METLRVKKKKFVCEACNKKITFLNTSWTQSDTVYGESYVEDPDERTVYDDGIRDLQVNCPKCGAEISFDECEYEDPSRWEESVKRLIDCEYTGKVYFKRFPYEENDTEYKEFKYKDGKRL